jgi:hypothetical protein
VFLERGFVLWVRTMSRARTTFLLALLTVLGLLPSGCSKPALDPDLALEGRELGELYDCYTTVCKRTEQPPRSPKDFKEFDESQFVGLRALRDGKYTVVWGVSPTDAGTVLAYAKDAPAQGGAVLMADGNVKKLSAEQLSAALGK